MAIQQLPFRSCRLYQLIALTLIEGALLSLATPALAKAGFSISTSGVIRDHIDLQQQRIVNGSWLSYLMPIEMNSYFISDSTTPAPGRRVVIRNVTPGLETQPFSDRAYSDPLGSEVIRLKSGRGHSTQTFTVLPGSLSAPKMNTFSYEIRDHDGSLLEGGNFSLGVTVNDTPITTVYLRQYDGYSDYGYAPNYYPPNYHLPNYYHGLAGHSYGGYAGQHRSIFNGTHFNRNLRRYIQNLPSGVHIY